MGGGYKGTTNTKAVRVTVAHINASLDTTPLFMKAVRVTVAHIGGLISHPRLLGFSQVSHYSATCIVAAPYYTLAPSLIALSMEPCSDSVAVGSGLA